MQTQAETLTVAEVLDSGLPSASREQRARLGQSFRDIPAAKLKEEIQKIKLLIGADAAASSDGAAADVLLDKTTIRAARRNLRIEKNRASINKFKEVLGLKEADAEFLVFVYASKASETFFDEALSQVLLAEPLKGKEDFEKALEAITVLKEQSPALKENNYVRNKQEITETSEKHFIPLALTKELLSLYLQPYAPAFAPRFNKVLEEVCACNPGGAGNAALAARACAGIITAEDACEMAAVAREIKYNLLDADLNVLCCRYMRARTPAEIAETFRAVLKRLPFIYTEAENLELAVGVMLDGTKSALDYAEASAAKRKEKELFRRALAKQEFFGLFARDIAHKFFGVKNTQQLTEMFESELSRLPYCSEVKENWDLACKRVLDILPAEEALSQAEYRRDLQARTLTEGYAPEVLKKYLGTQPPQEIISFFSESLEKYSFWRKDKQKHIFALEALVDELNGVSYSNITTALFEELEEGETLESAAHKYALLKQKNDADGKSAQQIKEIFKSL